MSTVSLREITGETVRAICALEVHPDQKKFVAPNAVSVAQAHFEPKAWFRAIYADDEPVGFAMLSVDTETPEYDLWRFMVDHRHQGKGYGRQAMALLIEHVRSLPGAKEFGLCYVPGEGSPQPFYASLGFKDTGEVFEGENIMLLKL